MRSGLAFDTNLLGSSLTRRLMALWMESSARSVVVLPTVAKELLRPNPHSTPRSRQLDEIYEGAWKSLWRESGSLYERRQLAADELEKAAAIHRSFTLRCFPRAADTGEIAQLNEAAIVAEAVATATTLLVTNNMNSIDHEEVNGLLAQQWGLNHDLLITADNALLTAHRCGEASRTLLTLFLAATWPADKPHLSVAECADTLKRCAQGLSVGARMPNVAVRLHNAFDVDEDLEFVIDSAKTLVRTSPALKLDHAWFDHVARGRRFLEGPDAPSERSLG